MKSTLLRTVAYPVQPGFQFSLQILERSEHSLRHKLHQLCRAQLQALQKAPLDVSDLVPQYSFSNLVGLKKLLITAIT
jgi:hypothetical protein